MSIFRCKTSCSSRHGSTNWDLTISRAAIPLSNPKDAAYFRAVRDLDLKHAKVAAFGMTRRRDVAAEDDQGMKALVERADECDHDRGEELGLARSRCSWAYRSKKTCG